MDAPRVSSWVVAALSVVVFAAVAVVMWGVGGREGDGHGSILPVVNAALNGASGVFLLAGYVLIRRQRRAAHKACMLTAFALSSLFLVTYLIHHAQVGSVPFGGTGTLRTVYFAILIPHVLLAAALVPLALVTIRRAWTGRYPAHRRIARWTLPIWLYVSASGVAVYVMLYRL